MSKTKIKFQGTVTYVPISGGFFGIVAEDGTKYRPIDTLPEDLRLDGLKVRGEATPDNQMSIFMWGRSVHILRIEPL